MKSLAKTQLVLKCNYNATVVNKQHKDSVVDVLIKGIVRIVFQSSIKYKINSMFSSAISTPGKV